MSYRHNKHARNRKAKALFKRQEAVRERTPTETTRLVRHIPRLNMPPPGSSPGIETYELSARTSTDAPIRVTCVDYCPEQIQFEQVTDLNNFLDQHRPAWPRVRWIQVEGLSRMVKMAGDALSSEQVSLFLGRSTLLSFLDSPSPVFESIYHQIELPASRLRTHDVSFLLHALIDAIVDSYFPALESYAECLEELDDELRARPAPNTLQRIHEVKRNLVLLRRSIWPMRELVVHLQRDKHECLSEITLTYFRDLYDHCAQIIDLLETYREIAVALTETYMAVVSNRLNEIMKVLTIFMAIFIPLSFLTGMFGMNMPIPGNEWAGAFPVFWIVCIAIAGVMLVLFRHRGWL